MLLSFVSIFALIVHGSFTTRFLSCNLHHYISFLYAVTFDMETDTRHTQPT